MSFERRLPRILVLDDLLGRSLRDRRNEERANFCGQFLLRDVTRDEPGDGALQPRISAPVAEAVFHRAQTPSCASVGDTVANDLEATLEVVQSGWRLSEGEVWAMVLLDLCFYTGEVTESSNHAAPGMPEGRPRDSEPSSYFGLQVLEAFHERFPELPVVMLSSMPREDVTLRYSVHGARGFIAKDDENAAETLRAQLWREGLIPDESGTILGTSLPLLMALRRARRSASERRNVLLRGERGVGKELFARFIHVSSPSSSRRPFVTVNSAMIGTTLFASELFGIKGRTATGVDAREGLIAQADGGDLFFDEVADMPPEVQAGILRVLEDRQVRSVGSTRSKSFDVRFISATNADIEARVASGMVRGDLVARLSEGGSLFLPPLRDRRSDIPVLAKSFMREAERSIPGAKRRALEAAALERLCEYDWPENIRGLRNCIFAAVSEYPGVEHLVPIHLHLPPAAETGRSVRPLGVDGVIGDRAPTMHDAAGLNELLDRMQAYPFGDLPGTDLGGRLGELRAASAQLMAKYLSAALLACRRPTDARLRIHPGMKYATGDDNLTAYQAADLIKRVLSIDPHTMESLLEDPILREAYESAVKLRGGDRR